MATYPCFWMCLQARYLFGGEVYTAVQRPYITSNHFDVDSFLSVWCYCNRQLAVQYEPGGQGG